MARVRLEPQRELRSPDQRPVPLQQSAAADPVVGKLEGATGVPAGTRPDPCRAAVRRVSRGLPAVGVLARDPARADAAGWLRRPGRTVAALGRAGPAALGCRRDAAGPADG